MFHLNTGFLTKSQLSRINSQFINPDTLTNLVKKDITGLGNCLSQVNFPMAAMLPTSIKTPAEIVVPRAVDCRIFINDTFC